MADHNPDSVHNNPKKRNNQLKRIFNDVKKFIKREGEEEKKPASFETSNKKKNKESDQQLESSSALKFETPKTQEAEKSIRERKAKTKEQKLPKKYRKGW
ncbi:MAG TPA: hypothetical protein VGK06_06660 [Methanosarcina sp.]|jgi:hypothetical protein